MKKIVILRSAGNELANQLWNYSAVYAYSLEHKVELENPSFFEYGCYFRMKAVRNIFFWMMFFLPFRNYTKRKGAMRRRIWRKIYTWLTGKLLVRYRKKGVVLNSKEDEGPYYLPPSAEPNAELKAAEKKDGTVYLDGWLFRNPVGMEKYRGEINKYFEPRKDIYEKILAEISDLKEKYKNIIGIHIRQGDYKTWRGGIYLIPQERVRKIIDEYLEFSGKNSAETCFVVTSDGPVDKNIFSGLNIQVSKGNAAYDLFLLSRMDAVIGSNSTFSAFASYYGNIPFIVMQKDKMDWEYYKEKKIFFENKYSTFVHY